MLSTLSTRELATAIWLLVAAIWLLRQAAVRRSIGSVLSHVLHPKILGPILVFGLYAAGAAWLFAKAGLWYPALVKDAVFWFVFVGLNVAFSGVTAPDGVTHFKSLIRQQLSLTVLLEFLLNTYVFSLPVELLIVPIFTGLALIQAVSGITVGTERVGKAAGCMQGFIGAVILGFVVHRLVVDLGSVQWGATLREFSLPPIMTLAAIPFSFLFVVMVRYELLFVRIGTSDLSLRRQAQYRMLRRLGLNLRAIERFMHDHTSDLVGMRTEADLNRLLPRET